MNAIVCNTLTGAVSEYARHGFQSITPTHGGSATGLFALGGDTDAGLPIVSEVRLPPTLRDENTLKKLIAMVYLSIKGGGCMRFTVYGEPPVVWSYTFGLSKSGQTRCEVGKGIRQNYMGFGLSNPAGQMFKLDRIEVQTLQSTSRRV